MNSSLLTIDYMEHEKSLKMAVLLNIKYFLLIVLI